ncbi:MAG: class I SAM-dependent methyltransferase [Planctomycetota bacterium]|jgi:2-polyprenyl-3-methyl-5-hydroxy-6-metoxy-1,4-benzoquinol methylase
MVEDETGSGGPATLDEATRKRIQREADHFDAEARTEGVFRATEAFDYLDHPCLPENNYLASLLADRPEAVRVLDIGCGVGEAAVCFAQRGAQVAAVDVSAAALEVGAEEARRAGVTVDYQLVHDYRLPFDDGAFDVVFGNGVLHHLDLPKSIPEIHRVTAPGGFGFFIEPTLGNPLIAVYRWLARNKRTEDERPITRSDLALLRSTFERVVVTPFQMTTLVVFLKMFLWERKNPNRVSYWREPILHPEQYGGIYRWANRWDRRARRYLPTLFRMLCWNNVVEVYR